MSLGGSAEVSVPPALYSEWVQCFKEVLTGSFKKQPLWKNAEGVTLVWRLNKESAPSATTPLRVVEVRVQLSGEGHDNNRNGLGISVYRWLQQDLYLD